MAVEPIGRALGKNGELSVRGSMTTTGNDAGHAYLALASVLRLF